MIETMQHQIVAEARSWIGTPYMHQASKCGAGTDCLGLVRGVWRAVIGEEPEPVPAYTADWGEPQREELLLSAAMAHFEHVADCRLAPGVVVLFRMRSGAIAKHMGIIGQVAPTPTFIHAYSGHAVLESPLSHPWQRKIAAVFSFPSGV